MDIPEAMELIKKAIKDDIPRLKGTHYNSDKYPLWVSQMNDILKEAFGSPSNAYHDLYIDFIRPHPPIRTYGGTTEDRKKQWYIDDIKIDELVLKKIVQRYELLGIPATPETAEVQTPKDSAEGEGYIKAELEQFRDRFARYKKLVLTQGALAQKRLIMPNRQQTELQTLCSALAREYGRLKAVIEEYGGSTEVFLRGGNYKCEAFTAAFSYTGFSLQTLTVVMDRAIAAVDIAIGNLQPLTLPESVATVTTSAPPKAFIAHGGQSAALNKLRDFLEALGVKPFIVAVQPSEGRLTEPQVDEYMKQADCGIILATYGYIVDTRTGQKHPRLNVVDELARCRKVFPDRTILLLERGVELGTNVSGIVYEHFTKQNMEKALIKVARELRAFGLIKAVKTQ